MVLDDLARYQQMVKNCYQKYLGEQYISELEKIIHPCGFYKNKAKNIKLCAKQREQELYQMRYMEQMETERKRGR